MKIKQTSPIIVLIVILLIGDIVFWGIGLYNDDETGIFMGTIVLIMIILMVTLMLKTVTITKEGCTITAFFRKKTYKWSELAIIRKDYWESGGKYTTRLDGIVFSEKKGKNGKIYSSYEIYSIYEKSPRLDCFCIVYDELDIKVMRFWRRWFRKTSDIRNPLEDIVEQLSEWGIEVEEGKNLQKEKSAKKSQKVYDEMVRIRKVRREEKRNIK